MATPPLQNTESLSDLDSLRESGLSPAEFWKRFMEFTAMVCDASALYLFSRTEDGSEAEAKPTWKNYGRWPESSTPGIPDLEDSLGALLELARNEGMASTRSTGSQPVGIGVLALQTGEREPAATCILLVFPDADRDRIKRGLEKARLLSDRPLLFQQNRQLDRVRVRNDMLSSVLDLTLLLSREEKFLSAAMTTCNELVPRFQCERVSVGWYRDGQIRLKAMSHAEKFEKKMELVRLLELAMEEAIDQEEDLRWPIVQDSGQVTRDHSRYAREAGVGYLCSIPLRQDGELCGVLFFERESGSFSESELLQMRLYADQIGPVLSDLQQKDRWIGFRAYHRFRSWAGGLIGVRHTGWKLAGLVISILLGILLFGKMTYRVEAPFSLQSKDVQYITAPFDGYLKAVTVEVGEQVEEEELLCQFDTQDLLLEKAVTRSDYLRLVRQAEQRRADNKLAEMRIIEAQAEQVEAELARINYRLDQASIRAPFAGVVVEGDLQEQIGSLFQTGDELYRLARLNELYAEVRVAEADVDEVSSNTSGKLIFKSRPGQRFPARVTRVEPMARTVESGNVFLVRVRLEEGNQPWFRPGMTGVAKLDAGKRSILWILTHRTLDYLRLHVFWW